MQCPDVVVANLDTHSFLGKQTVHVSEVVQCCFYHSLQNFYYKQLIHVVDSAEEKSFEKQPQASNSARTWNILILLLSSTVCCKKRGASPRGYSLVKAIQVCASLFWSENSIAFVHINFWSGIGYVFRRNCKNYVYKYLSFQFLMLNKKERVICEFNCNSTTTTTDYCKFYSKQYPLAAVSRLASQGEQWFIHYVIYMQIALNRDQRKRVKNVK